MYKLLIVDDEKEIREGLTAFWWEDIEIQLVGCCANGMEALQFVSETPPDILLADIRMPFMDGIELIEALRDHYPYIKVVLLSGYHEFEYAKKALQNGAFDYLLKPTDYKSVETTFKRLVKQLFVEKQGEYRRTVLERKENLLSKYLRREFLIQLFRHPLSEDEIEQRCSEGEILLDSDHFTVIILRLDRFGLDLIKLPHDEMKLILFSLENILTDIWDYMGFGYHVVDNDTTNCYLLSKRTDVNLLCIQVKQQLSRFMGLWKSTLSFSIGMQVNKMKDIWISSSTAIQLLKSRSHEDSIIEFTDKHHIFKEDHFVDKQEDRLDCKGDKIILSRAKQFIQHNYNRTITLKESAESVYVTPGYLSALFRETGETYLQFLTAIRVHKAKELLFDVRYKIYEVVEMVGFVDPAYFSAVFKKYTGMTPQEFRGAMR